MLPLVAAVAHKTQQETRSVSLVVQVAAAQKLALVVQESQHKETLAAVESRRAVVVGVLAL
jgi:hypothetical protein